MAITDRRLDRRRRRRRWPRRARRAAAWGCAGLMVALLAAAAGWGTRWLLTAPRFAVERVEVAGQGRLSAEDIIGASGIAPGQNLWYPYP